DIIGRWSEEKLDLLAQYLEAYSVIMNKQKQTWLRDYYYIDAFSGSVRPRAKDEERYINGSPIRALQTEPKFDGYWFVDVNPQRVERVEKLREDFPNQIIQTYQGNCNDILCNEIIPKIPYSSKKRAFVFLDPYGLQVDWKTVRELADTKTCDIFVNFSIMAVTRLLPRDQNPDPEFVKQIDQVMGNTEWITQIYRESPATQLSLFSNLAEPTLSREKIDPDWLARLYTEQLSSLFPHVSRPVLMRNSTNSVLYALCLASHNPNAIKITNDIFKRHERLKSR
ncbi:MAG: three-Cys-motif partner protein TcmP, partial [Pseudanabaena sp.]